MELGGIQGYIWCSFILNPSFVDTTFQVKHLMIGHVLDGGLFIYIFVSSNLHGSNGLLLLINFLFSYI